MHFASIVSLLLEPATYTRLLGSPRTNRGPDWGCGLWPFGCARTKRGPEGQGNPSVRSWAVMLRRPPSTGNRLGSERPQAGRSRADGMPWYCSLPGHVFPTNTVSSGCVGFIMRDTCSTWGGGIMRDTFYHEGYLLYMDLATSYTERLACTWPDSKLLLLLQHDKVSDIAM